MQVDGGATLEVNGDVTFSSISVDASRGCGTIKGGGFAENGTVHLENFVSTPTPVQRFPLALDGVSGAGNVSSWGVSIGGVAKPTWHVKCSGDELLICKPGCSIVIF